MTYTKTYEVYDPITNTLLVKGNAAECAEQLGMLRGTFMKAAIEPNYKRFKIVDTTEYDNMPSPAEAYADAIKSWDDFVTPIREKYGIPVYRGRK